jgi:hypothetical protein
MCKTFVHYLNTVAFIYVIPTNALIKVYVTIKVMWLCMVLKLGRFGQ